MAGALYGQLSGVIDADISLTAAGFQKPETMDAEASIAIRGASIVEIPLDLIRLKADYSQRKLSIDRLEAVSGRTALNCRIH